MRYKVKYLIKKLKQFELFLNILEIYYCEFDIKNQKQKKIICEFFIKKKLKKILIKNKKQKL